MNTRSIHFRLIVWYAAWLSAVFILFGVFAYFGCKRYLEAGVGLGQARRARQITDTLLPQMQRRGAAYVVQELEMLYAPEVNGRFIRLTGPDGKVIYASGPPKDLSFDPNAVSRVKGPIAKSFVRTERLPEGHELLVASAPFEAAPGQRFLIEVGAPVAPLLSALRPLVISLVVGLPIIVAVGVGGGYVLVRRALAPVIRIAEKAEQITLHSLSDRLPLSQTGDELERLSISLNHMITRLDEAFQQSKRFLADASHELRTPLTIMRGELENIAQRGQLDAEARDTVGSVLEEVESLVKIVEGLLALSRLDAGEAQTEWVEFDFAQLATTTAEQMCLLAEDKGVTVSCDAAREVPVRGDRARLKQIVVNLLDNAIKYTPRGGSVRLKIVSSNGDAVLEVADNGIGIPPEAVPHVFDRFFRVDKARSRELGGAGIGLSIVKAICAAHGGQIEVESAEGRGSQFRFKLPLEKAGS